MILSCNNWISIWILTESIILTNIILIRKISLNKELLIKYFIINSLRSSIIIILILLIRINIIIKINYIKISIFINLWIKLAIFPFHWWIILIRKFNNWIILFNINFFLKIPSLLILIRLNTKLTKILFVILIIPLIIINLNNIKKNLILISINNIYWFILIININNIIFVFTFLIYILINYFFFKLIKLNKINFINQCININIRFKILIIFIIINLINIPPLTIFLIKWLIIKSLYINNFLIFILILTNLIIIFNYFKIILLTLTEFNTNTKIYKNKKLNINLLINFFTLNLLY